MTTGRQLNYLGFGYVLCFADYMEYFRVLQVFFMVFRRWSVPRTIPLSLLIQFNKTIFTKQPVHTRLFSWRQHAPWFWCLETPRLNSMKTCYISVWGLTKNIYRALKEVDFNFSPAWKELLCYYYQSLDLWPAVIFVIVSFGNLLWGEG